MNKHKRFKLIWKGDVDKGDLSSETFDTLKEALARSEDLGKAGIDVVVLDIVHGVRSR